MKQLLVLALSFFIISFSNACTTFFLEKNGQMVFGKNYDWSTGTGTINTNLRGLAKSSLPIDSGPILRWTSKFGSITFNQYGKEFPNGGMNEKGLVVELMWLSESEYPAKDDRPGLSVLQWIQYQLDNHSSVREVIASDKIVRIISTNTPQHYLIADSKGDVATVEFLNGKMVVNRGANLPNAVLANSTYTASQQAYNSRRGGNNSFDRFSNACTMVQSYKKTNVNKPIVDYSFDILNKVSAGMGTKWSIVYDITNKKVYFKTNENRAVRSFAVASFDYSCSSKPLAYNIRQSEIGEITKNFRLYSGSNNKAMVKQAFRESSGINIKEALQDAVAGFPETVRCAK
jgi:penicillin V acylase-like amidase (Ntn superfamily)